MKNDEAVARVKEVLDEAKGIAKSTLNSTEALVVVHIGLMLFEERRKGKKVLPGGPMPTRPDPVQEARKTPRKPLMATPSAKTAPAKKAPRKR